MYVIKMKKHFSVILKNNKLLIPSKNLYNEKDNYEEYIKNLTYNLSVNVNFQNKMFDRD